MHSILSQPYTSLLRPCWTITRIPRLLATYGLHLIPGTATSAYGSCKPRTVRPRRHAKHLFPHTRPPDIHALEVGAACLDYQGSLVVGTRTTNAAGKIEPKHRRCVNKTFRNGGASADGSRSQSHKAGAFRNGGASADVSRRRGRRLQDAPPLECSVRSDELPVSMRMHFCLLPRAANVRARAYAHGHVCARARA